MQSLLCSPWITSSNTSVNYLYGCIILPLAGEKQVSEVTLLQYKGSMSPPRKSAKGTGA